LLEGSGAEDKVDYGALRHELENTPSRSIIIKDSASELSAMSFQGEPFLESSLHGTDFGESPIKGKSIDYVNNTRQYVSDISNSRASYGQTPTNTKDTPSHPEDVTVCSIANSV
jgi:hypothetical protein